MQEVNKNYTFDNLIISNNNNTIEILKNMNTSAYLLYIVGDVGVGRTHLVQAIINKSSEKNIIYITLEQFLFEFTEALRDKEYQHFIDKYINCDMLVIDDFQYCDNKEATQEELLKIIKILLHNNKKVILTSTKLISKFDSLNEHLKDYLFSALVLELNYLDENSKIELIKNKLKNLGLFLDDKDIKLLANKHKTVRAIDGAIYSIEASLNLNKI